MIQQSNTTLQNSLWALILGLFLTIQTGCMNGARRSGLDGDEEGYMADDECDGWEEKAENAIHTYKNSKLDDREKAEEIKQILNGDKGALTFLINDIFDNLEWNGCEFGRSLLRSMLQCMHRNNLIVLEDILDRLFSLKSDLELVPLEEILKTIHNSDTLSTDEKKAMLKRIFTGKTYSTYL